MPELRELPIQQMNLSEKGQFDYAKFAISIDGLEDEWFMDSGTDRETVKNIFFEIFNHNPDKDFSWILDEVFNSIREKMSYSEQKQNFLGLAALRVRLASESKNNFESSATKNLFIAKTVISKQIIASPAASGSVNKVLIKNSVIHPLSYLDSPAKAWEESQKPTKDEPIN